MVKKKVLNNQRSIIIDHFPFFFFFYFFPLWRDCSEWEEKGREWWRRRKNFNFDIPMRDEKCLKFPFSAALYYYFRYSRSVFRRGILLQPNIFNSLFLFFFFFSTLFFVFFVLSLWSYMWCLTSAMRSIWELDENKRLVA